MGVWKLDDIHWERFDPAKVDPELLRIVKAASLVEQNGGDYARYLCNVFADDPPFQAVARAWGTEEIQHGAALGRWAHLADPNFDHEAASARFTAGFRIDLDTETSLRGSRSGELVARCIVETGTSSYYTALAEATDEPVLKQICHRIAADELRHYKLFYSHLKRYLEPGRTGVWRRFKIALDRLLESDDDELAYAYYAANEPASVPYDRLRHNHAYVRRAYAVYRWCDIERGIAMIFKAVGLKPHGRLSVMTARLAWWVMQRRIARLERIPKR